MPRMRPSNGIVVGVVHNLEDPDSLGRVQVTYPHLDDEKSEWAPMATLMAGGGRGAFFRPDPKDKVLIGFEHNDPGRPYILGALWNKGDQPPADDGKPKDNNWRFIRSRSGHVVKLDDTAGAEKIEIVDKDDKRRVVIDTAGDKIMIVCDSGDIEITADKGDVTISAQNITLSADQDVSISASSGATTITGKPVNIN